MPRRSPNTMMKRRLIVLMLCVAALLVALSATAMADFDPLKVSMSLSSNTFTEPKTITVSIKVSNTGESEMPGPVTLYYPNGKQVEEFGSPTLAIGASQSWTGTWKVTQKQLENGKITFKIEYSLYNDNDELVRKQKSFSKAINYQGGVASVEVNRTIAPTTANKGQKISVTYDVVNTGTIDIKDVTITEDKSISSKKGTIASIKAGEKASYTFNATMGTKDLTSKATITYTADGKKTTVTKEAATVKYGEVQLSASLDADKKGGMSGDTVTLTLKLKNSGKTDYENVTVTDPVLGEVAANVTVPAGETVTVEKEISISDTTDYQFTVAGHDTDGADVTTTSPRVTVTAIDPNQVVNLAVATEVDRDTVYQLPGTVRFHTKVSNLSTSSVSDVSVYASGVLMYTFPKIGAGETKEFSRDVDVTMAGQYQFVARVKNQLGETQNFEGNVVRIAYTLPTPVPTEAPIVTPVAPVYLQMPTEADLSRDYATLHRYLRYASMALAVPAILGLGLVLVGGVRRARRAAESAKAVDHLERGTVRDYTEKSAHPNVIQSGEEIADEAESADV